MPIERKYIYAGLVALVLLVAVVLVCVKYNTPTDQCQVSPNVKVERFILDKCELKYGRCTLTRGREALVAVTFKNGKW